MRKRSRLPAWGSLGRWIFAALGLVAFWSEPLRAASDWAHREAVRKYPELGQAGSDFNRVFLDEVARLRQEDPRLFLRPHWPLEIADQVAAQRASRVSLSTEVWRFGLLLSCSMVTLWMAAFLVAPGNATLRNVAVLTGYSLLLHGIFLFVIGMLGGLISQTERSSMLSLMCYIVIFLYFILSVLLVAAAFDTGLLRAFCIMLFASILRYGATTLLGWERGADEIQAEIETAKRLLRERELPAAARESRR